MRWHRWWLMACAIAVIWAIVGYYASKPADQHDYRETATQAAKSAYYSLSTMDLVVHAQLDGKTIDTYVDSALDDSVKATADAAKEFAGAAPVDAATSRLRDQLGPLLLAAARALGNLQEVERSGDAQAIRRYAEELGPISDRLSKFIESQR